MKLVIFFEKVITELFNEYSSSVMSHRVNGEEAMTQGGARNGYIKGFSKI